MRSFVIGGSCDARFLRVREEFIENFRTRGEVGAALAVFIDGRPAVDLFGGYEDAARTREWAPQTRVNVFSVGKGFLAVCLGRAIEEFGLDVDSPVSAFWPEFAASGKGEISIRCLAAHRGGLPAMREPLPREALYDRERLVGVLAREAPWWEPGARHGYHVNTYGLLIGELVRRVSGLGIRAFFADRVAGPLQAEAEFGATDSARVADCLLGDGEIHFPHEDPEHELLLDRAYSNPPGISGNGTVNSAAWRAAELPSANAHATARGVASIYAGLVGRAGAALLSADTLDLLTQEHSVGADYVLERPSRFGLGFQLTSPERPLGTGTLGFGHFGAGGALGMADPENRLALGYVMNAPGPRWQNPRTRALLEAVYSSL